LLPTRTTERMESVEPKCMKFKIDMLLPNVTLEKRLVEDPIFAKPRTERVLASANQSNADSELPNLA
jgi:hypothetical protein